MPGLRLGHAGCATGTVGYLHCRVTIDFWRLDLGNAVVRHVQYCHRDGLAFLGENPGHADFAPHERSEEHTSELQSLMRTSYAVFCLQKNTTVLQSTTLNTRNLPT